ncbi:hypothetical protein PC120_g20915 [Phytophthora cactorum]|nr:hypothetical protein PC120_g20915 [Phytophthora cactorum]
MTASVVSTAPAGAESAPYPAPTTPAHAASDMSPVRDGVQPENGSVLASRGSARSIATSAPISSSLPIENSLVDVVVSVIRVPPAAPTSKTLVPPVPPVAYATLHSSDIPQASPSVGDGSLPMSLQAVPLPWAPSTRGEVG